MCIWSNWKAIGIMHIDMFSIFRKSIVSFLLSVFVGGISDSGVWSNTELAAKIKEKSAAIPGPRCLPGTTIQSNHMFLGDEIFPLDLHLMKLYSKKELDNKRRIFN